MKDKVTAIKIIADFESGEVVKVEYTSRMDFYPKGDLFRLDVLKDAVNWLAYEYNKELEIFDKSFKGKHCHDNTN